MSGNVAPRPGALRIIGRTMPPDAPLLDLQPEACWQAMRSRDARFDGHFVTGVTSTGIYCRPVCRVRTPRAANCRFFAHPAQAEQAGFRPCLRCRPELAPQPQRWSMQDAGAVLAEQAVRLLESPAAWTDEPPSAAALARRLGISDRHLRRLFESRLGVSPLQALQTRRLLAAKQLLTDTALTVEQVAQAAGFGSARRLQAAFAHHYRLSPLALRRAGDHTAGAGTLRLGWRPPCDADRLMAFLAQRALAGVEQVADGCYSRTLALSAHGQVHAGWFSARFDVARCQLVLQVAEPLWPVLPQLVERVRALFDLDADPQAIAAVLEPSLPAIGGLRVPGTVDGWELAVRAVLGQQVTVAAGRTLTQRLVHRFGTPLATSQPGLDRLFPGPQAIAAAPGDTLGGLGITRQRQAALQALARAVAEEGLSLHPGADPQVTMARLTALPGIGPWTASYIAMRALRWPDAFPAGDVALHNALGLRGCRDAAHAAEDLSQAWRPWRSYAVLRLWGWA